MDEHASGDNWPRGGRRAPSAGQHNSAALDLLQARAGLPIWMVRVHRTEHSPIIDRSQARAQRGSKEPGERPGRERWCCLRVGRSEVFEEGLGAEDQALAGDEVVALDVDFLGESLVCEDAHARADLVLPAVDHGLLFAGELVEFFAGGEIEGVAELLGLDAGHVVEVRAGEAVLVLAFPGAENGFNDAGLRKPDGCFADALAGAGAADFEAAHVAPLHEPPFELVGSEVDCAVIEYSEEFGVQGA